MISLLPLLLALLPMMMMPFVRLLSVFDSRIIIIIIIWSCAFFVSLHPLCACLAYSSGYFSVLCSIAFEGRRRQRENPNKNQAIVCFGVALV
jgi:hypothetical protein